MDSPTRRELAAQVAALERQVRYLHTLVYTPIGTRWRETAQARLEMNRTLAARVAELEAALGRVRQGYQNILEFRKLGGEWGQRDGFAVRYGALTREEVECVIAEIDAVLRAEVR